MDDAPIKAKGTYRKVGRTIQFSFEIDSEIAKHFMAGTTMRVALPRGEDAGECELPVHFDAPNAEPHVTRVSWIESSDNFFHIGAWSDDDKNRYREWLDRMPDDHPSKRDLHMPWEVDQA